MHVSGRHLQAKGLGLVTNWKRGLRRLMLALTLWSAAAHVQALGGAEDLGADLEQFNRTCDFSVIKSHVVDQHVFYGLASFYNTVAFYIVSRDRLEMLEPDQRVVLAEGEWFAAVGRFRVMAFGVPGTRVHMADQTFSCSGALHLELNAQVIRKDALKQIIPELDQLRYAHLWAPIAELARVVEWSLVCLRELSGFGWGMTLVVFSLLLKILLLPLGLVTARLQRQVSAYQSQLAPILADVKSKYDGEEAHKRIMAAHSDLGISAFFVLKPMWGMLIQIPIWIAVFNALGEMPQLEKASFLWIDSLAYPDSIGVLPFALPLLGDTISLLPLLMTAVTIMSALLIQNNLAPPDELRRQKRNTYLMAIGFFVLFYPFPAAMVFYWTFSNALQLLQQQIIKA
jgi:YidC/Oxa1 family membrane protein insertase